MDSAEIDLLDYIDTPVFVLENDVYSRPVFAAFNLAACRVVNRSAESIIGLTAEEVYSGELGRIIYERHCQAVTQGVSLTFELEFPIDGEIRFIRTSLKPKLSSEGKVIRVVGTVKEVTAEHDLREERSRFLAMSQEFETFISMSAHDLLTPIRNVRTLTDMLLDDFEDHGDGKLQIIHSLGKVSTVVMALIGDVLTHAEATGATESVENFELAGLCNDIKTMLDPEGRHSVQVDETLIHGDRTATQIVLRNLMDNAFKHNRNSDVTLRICAVMLYEGFFQITVEDDGVGIDEKTLQFFNGAELRSGNGFGLLGIRKLIRSRGGSLNAALPASGKGALIRFALPGKVLQQPQANTAWLAHAG